MFRKGHGRQRAVEPRRKHRLAAAGRPRQHEMVTTSPTTRAILSSIGSSNMSSKSGESSARAVSVVLVDPLKTPANTHSSTSARLVNAGSLASALSSQIGPANSRDPARSREPQQALKILSQRRHRKAHDSAHRTQTAIESKLAAKSQRLMSADGGPALIVNAMAIANGVKLAAVFAYRGRKG